MTLLHYLYNNIPGVAILPLSSEEAFSFHSITSKCLPEQFFKADVKQLGTAMEEEVVLVKTFCEKLIEQSQESVEAQAEVESIKIEGDKKTLRYKEFRLKLAELENKTDLLFEKISCNNRANEENKNVEIMDVSI